MKKVIRTGGLIAVIIVLLGMGTVCLAADANEAQGAQVRLNEQMVMAAAWMQNAAEYRALCYQAYNVATMAVDRAILKQPEQQKPLAVIFDCDETLIGNIDYDAGLVGTGEAPTYQGQSRWFQAKRAEAMPGALAFLQSLKAKNVEVFYVSNREEKEDGEVTRENLANLGFPYVDKQHVLLKTTTSNKQGRFDAVAKDYEVVVYMGDNAGDFPLATRGKGAEERKKIIDGNAQKFGVEFVVLPNPVYGDWELALAEQYGKLTPAQKDAARKAALKVWRAQ